MTATRTAPAGPGLVVRTHAPNLLEMNTAVFSDDEVYRYTLTRRWNSDQPPAVFVMLNPSTASAFTDDPTIRRCVSFARGWGCGGLIVLNLFAFRATNPAELARCSDPVGPDNDTIIRTTLTAAGDLGPVVVAWGTHGTYLDRAAMVAGTLTELGVQPQCLGLTKDHQPRHPLYMRGDAELRPLQKC